MAVTREVDDPVKNFFAADSGDLSLCLSDAVRDSNIISLVPAA